MTTMIAVSSERFTHVGYDPDEEILCCVFKKDGAKWNYAGVPQLKWDALLAAPSKGKYFNQEILGRYQGTRVA